MTTAKWFGWPVMAGFVVSGLAGPALAQDAAYIDCTYSKDGSTHFAKLAVSGGSILSWNDRAGQWQNVCGLGEIVLPFPDCTTKVEPYTLTVFGDNGGRIRPYLYNLVTIDRRTGALTIKYTNTGGTDLVGSGVCVAGQAPQMKPRQF